MIAFDQTINLGQVLEVAGIIGGGILVFIRMGEKVRTLSKDVGDIDKRLDRVDEELKKQTEILVSLGAQDARLTNVETQLALINKRIILTKDGE